MMASIVDWFKRTAPDADDPLPALERAGVSHLYFESVHPFEYGNGRIGRAISEKAMAQCIGQPTLVALAATIPRHRKAYYRALEAANKDKDITPWLKAFAEIAIEAQRRYTARIEFLIDKTKLLDSLRGRLRTRQEKPLRMVLREGPEGFTGGLSAGNYMTITATAPATARRDLADLVSKGALVRTGERRYTRCHLATLLGPVRPLMIDATVEVCQAVIRNQSETAGLAALPQEGALGIRCDGTRRRTSSGSILLLGSAAGAHATRSGPSANSRCQRR